MLLRLVKEPFLIKKIMSKISRLILSILVMTLSYSSYASHVAGGNISYSCTANPNEFVITLTFYRDCSGIPAPNSIVLDIENDCGLPNPVVVLPQIGFSEVSQLCAPAVPNSTCNGGPLSGVQEYIYQDTVDFGAGNVCDAWTMSFQVCARNPSTNLVGSECFYVETTMNSATQACNNSPIINAQPIPYVCNNAPVSYNYGVTEPDGDSLDFSFVAPLSNSGDSIDMVTGFSYASPIPGITIDPTTGQIDFTPVITGNFVVTILIKEYNCAGQLVGTLMHDIQFFIEDCVNIPPAAPPIVTNFNAFGTNAILTNGNKITMCTGDQMCFDAVFTDQDALDQLVLSSNIGDFLPGATITQSGTNPATATVCWIFQSGYTGSLISVNATDQVCTVPGLASFTVQLDVPPALFPGRDSAITRCGSDGMIDFNNFIGYHEAGTWYNENGDIINALVSLDTMTTGNYFHVVLPDTLMTGCDNSIVCLLGDTATVSLTVGAVNANWDENLFANESCIGQLDGTATVNNITGDGGPYNVVWTSPVGNYFNETVNDNGVSIVNGMFGTGLAPWNVTITDPIGCTWSHEFTVQSSLVTIDFNEGHPQCHGTSNGSIAVTATGPIDPGTIFTITNANGDVVNIPNTNTANSLPAGIYSVALTTTTGCQDEQFVELIDPKPIDVDIITIDPLCHGFATGEAIALGVYFTQDENGELYPNLQTTLGMKLAIDEAYFGWDPNPDPINTNGLGVNHIEGLVAGEYVVEVVDAFGCSNDITFFINDPDPLIGVVEVVSPTYCRTAGFQKGNGEVTVTTAGAGFSGTGNVTYLWENLENGDKDDVTTFIVNVPGQMLVTLTDENNCKYIDTVLVDSLNPIAAFSATSDQFHGPGEFEGTEATLGGVLDIQFVNESLYFSKPSYPLSDTVFKINLDAENDPNEFGGWLFSYDYNEKIKTKYTGEKEYLVCYVAKNFNGCTDTTCDYYTVHAFPELDIPNVFTPDAAPNDQFYFPSRGIEEFDCGVYNRYGIEVFHFNSIEDKWDGTNMNNGKPCQDGVYFYSYRATSTNNTPFDGQGNISLFRSGK